MSDQTRIEEKVRTRIAPSPTGYPHLGLIYQAIFDYVLARKYNGQFILRIEDTDQARFVKGAEDVIYDALSWVDLLPDEGPKEDGDFGPYRQSQRLELYKKYADELITKGYAYRCFCTKDRLDQMRKDQEKQHKAPMYDKTCLSLSKNEVEKNLNAGILSVIRMKIPDNETITVRDEIVGDVSFESSQIDEQILLKSDGFPTYHLAVVVDDHFMQITHVFRGTEWLPSSPKHVLLYKYFGWEHTMPKFIHIPVLLNSQGGGKLSKRHAHASVDYYKQEGFLPQAVVNYLANIVWNHPEDKEIFPITDFGEAMQLDPFKIDIKSTGVKFDLQKLIWINGLYIRDVLSDEALIDALYAYDSTLRDIDSQLFAKLVGIAKTRIKTLKEFKQLVDPFLSPIKQEILSGQKEILASLSADLEHINWNKETIAEIVVQKYILGKMITLKQLYTILIGTDKGLPLVDTFEILGKEKTLVLFQTNE